MANTPIKQDCTECIVDIIAYTWDLIKYILVYCGIYLNLYTCVHINRDMSIRGSIIRFKEINIHQRINSPTSSLYTSSMKTSPYTSSMIKQNARFMKLLIYYWSSKYTDKDFDTFIRIVNQHLGCLSDVSFTLVLNISNKKTVNQLRLYDRESYKSYNVNINIDLSNRIVNVKHITKNLLVCVHNIDDSYGFDLLDILDFAIGRSVCPLIPSIAL